VTFELPECPATTVTAQADPRNRVAESDEDNNGLQAGPFKCPDLIVEFDGSTGVLRITNAGTAQAGESRATVDGMSFEVPALDPGDSFSRDFCGRPGLTATVDVDGVVFESDEDNNSTPAGPCDTVA
jgi:subtilase family serine protease